MSTQQKQILVLAGGQSEEHEVSITSARALIEATQHSKLDITVRVIAQDGTWLDADASRSALDAGSAAGGGRNVLEAAAIAYSFDVVFPLLHGPRGEDGTVQGMLELARVPYVGSGVLGSSLSMDKAMAKEVLRARDIPQVDSVLLTRHAFTQNRATAVAEAKQVQGPWFVKPANLGSSIGISRVDVGDDMESALTTAFKYDRRAIIEHGIPHVRELEVAIMGNDTLRASTVGEISYDAAFYDYETKYTDGRAQLHIPAAVSDALASEIQELGMAAYAALDCAGFGRVDILLDPATDTPYVNEVNTIPGFTPFSMFTKLWEHAGVPYVQLIERLVELALERHNPAD